ncbi:NIF3-like protein 1 isoform X2 [Tachypleus tridentatus]|uniref:NIF3-like protein 1 isoform X2 n=2 Tax=Tachypleus tridentatus TaxID=6853 RepID=UPI003FCF0FC6
MLLLAYFNKLKRVNYKVLNLFLMKHDIFFVKKSVSVQCANIIKDCSTTSATYSVKKLGFKKMDLKFVVEKLQQMAPLYLAESWDNVGLLVEPSEPLQVKNIMLTNDLTIPVLKEAVEREAQLIVSYHPPIFKPLKSLTNKTWKERIIVECLEHKIAVYSQHTAFDAINKGVNDWLIRCFDYSSVQPIKQSLEPFTTSATHHLNIRIPLEHCEVLQDLMKIPYVFCTDISTGSDAQDVRFRLPLSAVSGIMAVLSKIPGVVPSLLKLEPLPIPGSGPGRICFLKKPLSLSHVVDTVKKHLGINTLRVAEAVGSTPSSQVSVVAVCAGSGASLLLGVKADLYLTGEMSHHEVLEATHTGKHVILCEHSTSERGFLLELKERLECELVDVCVFVSKNDKEPLKYI